MVIHITFPITNKNIRRLRKVENKKKKKGYYFVKYIILRYGIRSSGIVVVKLHKTMRIIIIIDRGSGRTMYIYIYGVTEL